jgi:hypothetical protein
MRSKESERRSFRSLPGVQSAKLRSTLRRGVHLCDSVVRREELRLDAVLYRLALEVLDSLGDRDASGQFLEQFPWV